jgi:hypothetical protein
VKRRTLVIAACVAALLAALSITAPAFAGSGPNSTSALAGNLGPYYYTPITASNGHTTYVSNNMWGCGSIQPPAKGAYCGVQTVYAYNPGDWWVVSDQRAGNTGVLTYPDVGQVFTNASDQDPALSTLGAIWGTFAMSAQPRRGDYEAAFDIWLNGNRANEIMIWVYNHGQRPAGSITGHAVIWGQHFTVWSTRGNRGTVSLVLNRNETAGQVHVLTTMQWLAAHKYITLSQGLSQVDFGWEICSTGGIPEKFAVTKYTLRT